MLQNNQYQRTYYVHERQYLYNMYLPAYYMKEIPIYLSNTLQDKDKNSLLNYVGKWLGTYLSIRTYSYYGMHIKLYVYGLKYR